MLYCRMQYFNEAINHNFKKERKIFLDSRNWTGPKSSLADILSNLVDIKQHFWDMVLYKEKEFI